MKNILFGVALFVAAFSAAFGIVKTDIASKLRTEQQSAVQQIEQLEQSVQTMIDSEQTRLGRPVLIADPFKGRDARTLDIQVRLQYLHWKIEVAIMLQRINSGTDKRPGVPGSSSVKPFGMAGDAAQN